MPYPPSDDLIRRFGPDVQDKFINLIKPPTSSLVEVNELVVPDIMIEVEATAIIVKR